MPAPAVQPQPQPQPQPRPAAPQIPIELIRAGEMVKALWADQEVGPRLRKLAKEKYPDISIPEEQVNPIVAPLVKRIDDMAAEWKADREAKKKADDEATEASTKRTLEDALASARQKYNLTEEGFDKMVARMKETGNYGDPEAAAAWVVSKEPPPRSPGPSFAPQKLDMKGSFSEDKVKLLHTDPSEYENQELAEFLRDPDKYVVETLGSDFARGKAA